MAAIGQQLGLTPSTMTGLVDRLEEQGFELLPGEHPIVPIMLYDAVKLFGRCEPIFREALLNMTDRFMWGPEPPEALALEVGPKNVKLQDPAMNASMFAYAYDLSGDVQYAAYARHYLERAFLKKVSSIGPR